MVISIDIYLLFKIILPEFDIILLGINGEFWFMEKIEETNIFDDILGEDEKILFVLRPNKTRFVWLNNLFGRILGLLFGLVFVILGILASQLGIEEADLLPSQISFILFGAFFILIVLIEIICVNVMYKKTFYALSDKRILVRTGIIGVDFRNLDISFVGSVNINVNLYDKFLKPNTGTISFGSFAAPIANPSGVSMAFNFKYIDNPYDVYKSIKKMIDDIKKDTSNLVADKVSNNIQK